MLEIRYKSDTEVGQRIVSRTELPERRRALMAKGFRFVGRDANTAVKGSYKVRYVSDRRATAIVPTVAPTGVVAALPVTPVARVSNSNLTPLQAKVRANRKALERANAPTPVLTLEGFYDELKKHDWFYRMSDDHRYYVPGEKSLKRVLKIAEQSTEHKALYDAFHAHHFSGPNFGGGERSPLPERPCAVAVPAVPDAHGIRCRVRPICDARRSADFGEVATNETEMLRLEKEFAAKLAAEEEIDRGAIELESRVVIPVSSRRIQDGIYTIVFGDGHHRTLRFQKKTRSNLAGKTIVSYLSGSDNERHYTACAFYDQENGRCSIWGRFRIRGTEALGEEILSAVGVILRDPQGAMEAYALRSGRCARCNKVLTVPASIHRGIGPDCFRLMGGLR